MKKRSKSDSSETPITVQEMITNMNDDLLTVLDSYMDEMDMQDVFYYALKFMTFTMYECLEDHKLSLKTLRHAMDQGIQLHMQTKEPHDKRED